jgi:hypothetical protein
MLKFVSDNTKSSFVLPDDSADQGRRCSDNHNARIMMGYSGWMFRTFRQILVPSFVVSTTGKSVGGILTEYPFLAKIDESGVSTLAEQYNRNNTFPTEGLIMTPTYQSTIEVTNIGAVTPYDDKKEPIICGIAQE